MSLEEYRARIDALVTDLEFALAAEHDALRTRDSAALEATAARKLELLRELEAASGNYCRAGGNLGDAALADVRARAKECMRANRANGGAIELNRNLVGRLLDTLRGGTRGPATYDASGRVRQRDSARQVGLA